MLALAASAAWGLSDFLGGLASRGRPAVAVLVVSQTTGLIPLTVLALVVGGDAPSGVWVPGLLGGVSTGLGLLALYRALAIGPMSVVAPLFPLGAIVPVAVGVLSGDRPSWIQGVGIVAAVGGCFLAARAPGDEGGPVVRAGIVAALLAALGIGGGIVGLDAAADHDAIWGLEAARAGALAAIAAVAVATIGPARLRRDVVPMRPLATIGLIDVSANASLAFATTFGLISIVSVLSSIYPVVTVLLARAVLKERMQSVQVVGVALAFGGVAALVAG
ncbi:MAG TPA: DMT family transporter [Capillimicrobium sp.]|nr:DMT family transporter [Capillimicrobium sp.]